MSKVVKSDQMPAGFTHRTAMEEAARCLLCHDAPCSKGCPAGTDPAKFIRSIRFRNVKGAAETIRKNNILGGSCAMVCPYDRFCEEACSRCGIDRPVEIGKLQRYAIEQEKASGMHVLKAPEEKRKERIACIGAGPASLSCAAELAKSGYNVTVYERHEKAGGMLTYGIASERLPQEVVDHDVDQVKGLGVKLELGKTVTPDDLTEYDAVFVGTGLWGSNIPDITGADGDNVYAAVDFLKNARDGEIRPGRRVVVVGGGDVAVDCAVTAKRLGADDVKIVYRRTIEEAPANMKELHYAVERGIGITTGMAPVFIGNGKITFRGFRDESSHMEIPADTVVFATGQVREDLIPDVEKYFAAGDVINGGRTVVEAVAGGKDTAAEIMEYLQKGVE